MKVKCIDNTEYIGQFLTLGKEYVVISEDKLLYAILDDNNNVQKVFKSRFEKVEEKQPMKVKCIKNDGTSNRDFNLFLTLGKIYEAKKNISGVAYTIKDDSGGERNFPLSYFIEIKKEEPKFNKIENIKEQELKALQNYLISELNKVSDQLERIQSNKR
jgi:hypothetical protein